MANRNKRRNRLYVFGLIVLGFIIGLLGIVHLRSNAARITDPSMPNIALQKTVSNLEQEQYDLKKQSAELEKQVSADEESLRQRKDASAGNVGKLKDVKSAAGLSIENGKGAIITLSDSQNTQSSNVQSFLIHASDLRDLVNLLWLSDAKAISINNERIVFVSSIDCLVNTILVNNTNLGPPYKVAVIGDQAKIKSYLENDNNLTDFKNRVKKNNLVFTTDYKDKVEIPAYSSSFNFNYLN
jgi:uncharacterized protein YlxW (UPF0749 family)